MGLRLESRLAWASDERVRRHVNNNGQKTNILTPIRDAHLVPACSSEINIETFSCQDKQTIDVLLNLFFSTFAMQLEGQ